MIELVSGTALALGLLVAGTVPALAANSTPQRPDGQVVPSAPSGNGGDKG